MHIFNPLVWRVPLHPPGQGTAGIGTEIEGRKVVNLPIYLLVRSVLPHSGFIQGVMFQELVLIVFKVAKAGMLGDPSWARGGHAGNPALWSDSACTQGAPGIHQVSWEGVNMTAKQNRQLSLPAAAGFPCGAVVRSASALGVSRYPPEMLDGFQPPGSWEAGVMLC